MSTSAATATVVKNTLPKEIVALDAEILAKANALVFQANGLVMIDAAGLTSGNATFKAIDSLKKEIEAQRLELTRPIDDLKKAIIEAERQATTPLIEARTELGKRILDLQRKLEAERAEAERKARAEAEAKAAAERARLEAERQALIAKQRAEYEAAQEAAAKAHAEAMAKATEEAALFGTPVAAVEIQAPIAPPEPPPVVVVPVVDAVRVSEVPKGAVRTNTRKVLRIVDAAKIPRELAGVVLLVPDEKAIKKLLEAGIAVPGAVLETVNGMAAVGSR